MTSFQGIQKIPKLLNFREYGGGGGNGFAAYGDSPLRGALRASKMDCVAFCEPTTWLLFPATALKQKCRPNGRHRCLVEVVGIEPTSASPLPQDLHAYSVFNLTMGYPTGRENS